MTDTLDDTTEFIALLAKIDQAIRLLEESQRKNPRAKVRMAVAALESARDALTGNKKPIDQGLAAAAGPRRSSSWRQ
jgi:hypothetical protein